MKNKLFSVYLQDRVWEEGLSGKERGFGEKSNGKEQITGISEDQKEPNIILVEISSHSLFLQPVGHDFSF